MRGPAPSPRRWTSGPATGSGRARGADSRRRGPRSCRLTWPEGRAELDLRVPGRHNQLNAAAAFLATVRLGGDPARAARGMARFPGVGRRLERLAAWPDLKVFDDYAHHPTEVAASIAALREAHPEARLTVVFQPHLFTRTRDFAEAFAEALSAADDARVLPVYPARETPIPGVTSALITDAAAVAEPINRDDALDLAAPFDPAAGGPGGGDGDAVLVFMGAGDVTDLAHAVVRRRADDAVGA